MPEKIVRFEAGGLVNWGMVDESGETVQALDGLPYERRQLADRKYALNSIRLLPPVCPEKIVCGGLNYARHVQHSQSADKIPDEPVLFLKPPSALIGHLDMINYPPGVDRGDYEAELGVVIGRTLHRADPDECRRAVFGLTCVNDVTARNLQKKDGQWTRAKSFDTFCPVGPWIVTDTDWSDLKVEAWLNGQLRQSGRTSDMIFKPEVLISFISGVMTLRPGDLISTGTPEGIDPMNIGDRIEIVVENVGRLINTIGA